MKKLLSLGIGVLAVISLLLGGYNYFSSHQTQPSLLGEAANPGTAPLFDTVLTQQLGTSDTTMYLQGNSSNELVDNQGNVITGYQCFTIDVNSPSVEYVCGTVSGDTVTNLVRNISYKTGTSTYATPTYIHRVGADVRITDFPALTILNNQNNGTQSFPSPLFYASHPCTVSSASTTICDKNYIDNQVTAGAAAGSPTTAGIFLGATQGEAASSTATGVYNSVTYNRVLGANLATDTPNTATRTGRVLMSDLTGYLKQGWLNLTKLFTFSGGILSTASSTYSATTSIAASNVHNRALILNGVAYSFPSSGLASSTAWEFDANGKATYEPIPTTASGQFSTTTASIGNISVTTNFKPKSITIYAECANGSSSIWTDSHGTYTAGTQSSTYFYQPNSGPVTLGQNNGNIVYLVEGGSAVVEGSITSVSSTGFVLNLSVNGGCGSNNSYYQWTASS